MLCKKWQQNFNLKSRDSVNFKPLFCHFMMFTHIDETNRYKCNYKGEFAVYCSVFLIF